MNEIIGNLGLAPNLAALIWAGYGGWRLAVFWRNGKNGKNGNGRNPTAAQFAALETRLEERTKALEGSLDLMRSDIAQTREDAAKGLAELHRRVDRLLESR